jgi:2-oxoglutarate dehydrogenase E2 component (dihydrolipoamide succinyltransferase)
MEPQAFFSHDPASGSTDTGASSATEQPAHGAASDSTELPQPDDATKTKTKTNDDPRDEPRGSGDALSPSVRRLVRQYDLDVSRIRGTGPDGRIRVGDVISLIGTRGDAPRDAKHFTPTPVARHPPLAVHDSDDDDDDDDADAAHAAADADAHAHAHAHAHAARAAHADEAAAELESDRVSSAMSPVTTVFECDLGRVLTHRKRHAQHGVEPTITSYYLVACGAALESVPEVGASPERVGEIGVWLGTSDGDAKPLLIDVAAEPPGTPAGTRVQGVDLRIRAAATSAATAAAADPDEDPFEGAATSMLVHQHGASGSLFATATPLGPGHAASLGVGRVRKQIVVRHVDGDDGPRVAALAYLTLSFDPRRVTLQRANRFMGELVRFLEYWPED